MRISQSWVINTEQKAGIITCFVRLLMVTWLNIWLFTSEFSDNSCFCFNFLMKPDHYINYELQTVLQYTVCDEVL